MLEQTDAAQAHVVRGRTPGFIADVRSISGRGMRSIPRDMDAIIPGLVIPVFFYLVNTGALERFTEAQTPGFDYKAFQVPVAILFGVTGITRASTLVTDIQSGYFDRLLLSPVSRAALLLGLMVADFVLAIVLAVPVIVMGFLTGVQFQTGVVGLVVFVVLTATWGLMYAGFPYAIALKTGNPAAVNTSFLLFFPFAFLTTTFLPRDALSGWLDTVAGWNPVTYLLDGLRSLLSGSFDGAALAKAFLAIGLVGTVSLTLAFRAMKSRVEQN